jgi:hypothetical protein
MRALLHQNQSLAAFEGDVRSLEAALLLRMQQAARACLELQSKAGGPVRSIARVWLGAQRHWLDMANSEATVPSGDLALTTAYLRHRAILPAAAAGLADVDVLSVTDQMRLLGQIELGRVLDAAAAALDAVDAAATA